MDDHNNAIGLSIGADARSHEEVIRRARAAIDAGAWGVASPRAAVLRGTPWRRRGRRRIG
jgi:hypothetical protein